MKKAIRFLRGLSLFCLCFFVAFICGAAISGTLGVAKGQGLAGGAIVFWYGILSGTGGLITAFFLVKNASITTIKILNLCLFIVSFILVAWIAFEVNKKTLETMESQQSPTPSTITQPVN